MNDIVESDMFVLTLALQEDSDAEVANRKFYLANFLDLERQFLTWLDQETRFSGKNVSAMGRRIHFVAKTTEQK